MIKIENITKKFGEQVVLDKLSFEIKKGEKILIMGQNGAGKSTLTKALLGELELNLGRVLIRDIDVRKERKKALKNIAFVPQTPPLLRLCVSELCEYAMKTSEISLNKICSYLKELDFSFENEAKKQFFKLSGGMKQKVLIAIALAKNADITIFDEPTANLDPMARQGFLRILSRDFSDKTLIFISHRSEEIKPTRIIEMDLGKIILDKIVS